MSIERNPNINAAGLAVDMIASFCKHSRGKPTEDHDKFSQSISWFCEMTQEFVLQVSEKLDREFPVTQYTPE
jgi:hypothetical protein